MNSVRTFGIALVALLALNLSQAGTGKFRERERIYDVLHYAIDLRIDDEARRVRGTVRMRLSPLRPVSSITVDAEDMSISSVTMKDAQEGEITIPFHVTPKAVEVQFPRTLTPKDTVVVAIAYEATPQAGLYFMAPDHAYPDLPRVVWSQGEMESNHFWIPCYDYPNEKATVEMRVTVDERYRAISNGALLSVTRNDGEKTRTFFWFSAKPMASYLISVVVGDYAQLKDHAGLIPLEYNVYPSQAGDALRSFEKTPDMMRFFADKTGFAYPWAKYSQTVVPNFTYGGMENTSATTLTDRTIHSARAHIDVQSEGLVAHELAHQWFGDLVTCRSWAHAWLNEGFATFFQMLYDGWRLGNDALEHEIEVGHDSLVRIDRGPERRATVSNAYVEPEDVFDSRIYQRGACILHMLRFVMGDSLFWEGMRHYVDLYQYQCVSTDDFRHAMEDAAGQDLGWFFDEWVYHAGYPELTVVPVFDSTASMLHLDVDQTQPVDSLTPLFRMPVAVEVTTDAGARVQTVNMAAIRHQRISIPCPAPPRNVVFDKGDWVLKNATIVKPPAMWREQLAHGDVVDRSNALEALAPMIAHPEIFSMVAELLKHDPFWAVRSDAAKLLAGSGSADALQALAPSFSDSDARVRAAATAGLRHFRALDALVALGSILVHDSSEAVKAEAIVSLAAIDSAHALDYCEKGLGMDSHGSVIRVAAVRAMGALRTDRAKARLLDLTTYGQIQDVRVAAIDALVDHWPEDPEVRKAVGELLHDPLFRVRLKSIGRLPDLREAATRNILEEISAHDPQSLLRREARRSLARMDRTRLRPGE